MLLIQILNIEIYAYYRRYEEEEMKVIIEKNELGKLNRVK